MSENAPLPQDLPNTAVQPKLGELLASVPEKPKKPNVKYKSIWIISELYDDLAQLAREQRMSVGDAATILIVEGAFAAKAKLDAAEAERLKAESEQVAEIHLPPQGPPTPEEVEASI